MVFKEGGGKKIVGRSACRGLRKKGIFVFLAKKMQQQALFRFVVGRG